MNKKKICIIGAGIGGLTAGALLSKQGHEVYIYEKEALIGGRASSINMTNISLQRYITLLNRFNMEIAFSDPPVKKIFNEGLLKGYNIELGYHLIGGGIINSLKKILNISDVQSNILESRLYIQKDEKYDFFVTTFDKIMMFPNILRLLFSGEKTMEKLDNITLVETIKKYGKGKMKLVLEVNSRLITTVNNLDKISTGEVFRTQKNMRLKGVRYPKGGLSNITNKLADLIILNGGNIKINSPVKKIIVKDKKATGIIVNGEEHSFDIVISNIIVQNLFRIVDEKHFPKNYIKSLNSLYGTGSLCAYYSFNSIRKDLLNKTFAFIERNVNLDGKDVVGMIDFMAASPESGLSPKSKYLVQSYIVCTPEEAKNKEKLLILKRLLDKNLEKIIPNYKSNLNWAIYPTTWHLDGVAKTIDNIKPEIQTPIENLYLVGDCVKAPGIGINCAINSAKILNSVLAEK